MSLDFKQLRDQINRIGEHAPQRAEVLRALHEEAFILLDRHAQDLDFLRDRVAYAATSVDPNLRCAMPVVEALNTRFPLPMLPETATILAADGSQINPDRHADIYFGLINVGAIQFRMGLSHPPQITVASHLLYDEQLYTETGIITDTRLALLRDLNERKMVVEMTSKAQSPVISFTDGPLELWGTKEGEGWTEFQQNLDAYMDVLKQLGVLGAVTCGYVDKPAANLVLRMLEIAVMAEPQRQDIRRLHPLRGVYDLDLFHRLLEPGERSAVFAIQSKSARAYKDELALHFFYLNVGRPGRSWIARVEIPQWVAEDDRKLNDLQAVLVHQCRIMGNRAYPYLLHRAHETAVISWDEREQISRMIAIELRSQGVAVGAASEKQILKRAPSSRR